MLPQFRLQNRARSARSPERDPESATHFESESPNSMSTPPDWLSRMANAAAEAIEGVDVLSPLGCHYHCEDGVWEVALFASLTQVVGGAQDGVLRRSRFSVDLLKIMRIFSKASVLNWQAHQFSAADELGAHVAVEGIYEGETVSLRILSTPPRRFPAGRQATIYEAAWNDIW